MLIHELVPHPDLALADGDRDRADRLDRVLDEGRTSRGGRNRPRAGTRRFPTWRSLTTTSSGSARRCRSSTSSASTCSSSARAATGSGCARSMPSARRRSTCARRPGATAASAATSRATCSRSCRSTSTSTSSVPWSTSPTGRGSSSPYTDAGQSRERARRKRLVDGDGARRSSGITTRLLKSRRTRARRATTCAAAAWRATWRASSSSAGRPTIGMRWRASRGSTPTCLRDNGLAFRNKAQPDAGRVPGAGAVPDLLGERRGGGDRRADPAREQRPGEVQELARDADLHEVADAVRAELGEGRHRQRQPGDRVRGIHRRDRVPPRRRATGGGDVRDGVHRGARAPAQALRQPGGAGVRRRQRRSGRGRALLRVGGEVPGRGQRGGVPAGQGPGRAGADRPGGAGAGGGGCAAVPRVPAGAGARRPGAEVAGGGRATG